MSETWSLKRTKQCGKCPWRVGVDPHGIPNGYSVEKHKALASTIAQPGDLRGAFGGSLNIMACHETDDAHCVGWLLNQLGPGNNIGLRLSMMGCSNAGDLQTYGPQHLYFEDTLPKPGRPDRRRSKEIATRQAGEGDTPDVG